MSGGLHSLATIIKRLEAATSRLEDLAVAQASSTVARSSDEFRDEPNPNAPPAPVPPPHSSQPQAAVAPAPDPPAVAAYDEQVLDAHVQPFARLTREYFPGSPLAEQADLVEALFRELRGLIALAAACQRPADAATLQPLLRPLAESMQAVEHVKEANFKNREFALHFTVLSDGTQAMQWVMETKPAPYIQEMINASKYSGDKILREHKDKEPKHGEWVRAFFASLDALRKYVAEHHTTGLSWNPKGILVNQYKAPSSASASSASGAPAPPPPPPPPGPPPPPAPPAPSTSSAPAPAGGIGAVFADLNRGEEVTKGLRKVDKSEMTHKNPALRAVSTVPAEVAPAPGKRPPLPKKPTKPASLQGKKPAKLALEGNKWMIEYQENEHGLTVEDTERSQTVNLFGCKNATVVIKGKCNAVTLVQCTKTSVLVDSVISSISVTSSPSFTLQITGSAPTIQLDSTDSGQIYLSKACADTIEIFSAKCSAINVSLPVEGEEEGVFEERAMPEMLRTVVQKGQLVTSIVEHAG
ncbi:hypothetical protein PUNSTDRAFT_103929 [Punctularia strigosozonata HHB-11173 SS5]|uniref:uncharacterized protein n=1 Tax=Punctularia strigosozonata (strain HHB-11173) TaxID=741275 RepID=UPI00044176B2|nr:uncharacterized protein PUNSTDRAFT_103929 [Punctularia strigosozonata HHB-11173 SS5]EIN07817.1 hypothetical protein PUNSTDRAFT_103929 [Punctularia strigosozonata HHB-11173 SS5]